MHPGSYFRIFAGPQPVNRQLYMNGNLVTHCYKKYHSNNNQCRFPMKPVNNPTRNQQVQRNPFRHPADEPHHLVKKGRMDAIEYGKKLNVK
jgi:hypothetical protein